MIFEILFLISLLGIIILALIYKKNNKSEKLLHSLCKSCNIDSVKFEKRLKLFISYIKKVIEKTNSFLKKIFRKVSIYKNNFLNYTKQGIRKKLFKKQKVEKVSEYISEIKK